MADETDLSEKTEDPTQKRLDDALERGDVVKSQEVNTWFIIAGATLALAAFSGAMGTMQASLRSLLENAHRFRTDGPGLLWLAEQMEYAIIAAFGMPLLILVIAAIFGNIVQHRLVFSAETLKPKLSKISPIAGAKRVFGKQAWANLLKGIFKVVAIGVVMTLVFWPERHRLDAMVRMDPMSIVTATRSLSLQLLGTVVAMLAAVAIADYLFQYRTWFERQRMSLQEIKDEYKQTEGDPQIKGRLRQLRDARRKRRMMAAVPTASVVITNPTHFAVALKYEQGMAAPICVAKGLDAIALRIRQVAKDNDVPVIENPPLARALHAAVKIDDEIPVEHYQAVAEVIGYIMRLKRGFAGLGR
jgi:flagellar biosynthetic protein FlhB